MFLSQYCIPGNRHKVVHDTYMYGEVAHDASGDTFRH